MPAWEQRQVSAALLAHLVVLTISLPPTCPKIPCQAQRGCLLALHTRMHPCPAKCREHINTRLVAQRCIRFADEQTAHWCLRQCHKALPLVCNLLKAQCTSHFQCMCCVQNAISTSTSSGATAVMEAPAVATAGPAGAPETAC